MPPLAAQRMRNIIYPRAAAQAENLNFTVGSVTGSLFTGTTSDLVSYPVAIHGYYNWRNIAIACAVCEEGDVILDIGANVGSETIGFSDIVGASGVVYAFEPFPPNLERLQVNSEQTRYSNITVFPLALSDRDADVRFVPPTPDNSGRGHLMDPRDKDIRSLSSDILDVHCTTLDSLLPQMVRPPQLVVVDAEGHEAAILRGAEQMLALHHPVIVLEVLGQLLARAGTSPDALATHLRSFDYSLFELTRFRVAPIDVEERQFPDTSDWLAVPASRSNAIKRIRHTIRRCGLMPCIPPLNPLRLT
jgi:FkbM family methyltransferase